MVKAIDIVPVLKKGSDDGSRGTLKRGVVVLEKRGEVCEIQLSASA